MDTYWVTPLGELGLASAPQLDEAIHGALAHGRVIVLDLRGLTFVDSAGVHLVVNASIGARFPTRQLIVFHGHTHVRRVFELTDTLDHLDTCDPPV